MEGLTQAVSRSSAGTRLLKLLQTVTHNREAIAGAILDVLHEQGGAVLGI